MSYDKFPSSGRFRERPGTVHTDENVKLGYSGYVYLGKDTKTADFVRDIRYVDPEFCIDSLHAGPPYLSGDPFFCDKSSNGQTLCGGGRYYSHSGVNAYYDGQFLLTWPSDLLSDYDLEMVGQDGSPYDYDWSEAQSFGASAWNRFRPKLSTADLGVAMAEARDIPRMLKKTAEAFHVLWKGMRCKSQATMPKTIADHWLNTQFGWAPFINDLSKTFKTAFDFNTNLQRMRKHNGRWLKRSGSFSHSENSERTSTGTSTCFWPAVSSNIYASPIASQRYYWTIDHTSIDDVWFEGRFRYWIPALSEDTPYATAANLLRMYGLRISPSLIWEATPWSWLVDWFSNAGDIVNNLTAMRYDNLTAKYAYIMRRRYHAYVLNGSMFLKDATISGTSIRHIQSKSREVASPFGFGLSWDELSPWQLSILSAIGLSRR